MLMVNEPRTSDKRTRRHIFQLRSIRKTQQGATAYYTYSRSSDRFSRRSNTWSNLVANRLREVVIAPFGPKPYWLMTCACPRQNVLNAWPAPLSSSTCEGLPWEVYGIWGVGTLNKLLCSPALQESVRHESSMPQQLRQHEGREL